MLVSNIFYFHPYLGKIPILANIFQRGWNHQPVFYSVHLKTVPAICFLVPSSEFMTEYVGLPGFHWFVGWAFLSKIGLKCSNLQLCPLFFGCLANLWKSLGAKVTKVPRIKSYIEAYGTNISKIWSWSKGIHLVAWQAFFEFVDVTSEPARTSIWTSHLPSGVVALVRHTTVYGWNPAPPGMFLEIMW